MRWTDRDAVARLHGVDATSHTAAEVLERFNRAFLEHDPSLLPPLTEPDPVRWTPRSTMSVIHGRPVRSLATNREPAVGG